MPGQDLHPVKPPVLHYQKPSRVPECVQPAYGTRRALLDLVLHRCPPGRFDQTLAAARAKNRGLALSRSGTVSIPSTGSKRSVKCAAHTSHSQKCSRRRSLRRFPWNAAPRSEGKSSARNSLPSRRERNGAVQIGLAHLWSMEAGSLLMSEFRPESVAVNARRWPNPYGWRLEEVNA